MMLGVLFVTLITLTSRRKEILFARSKGLFSSFRRKKDYQKFSDDNQNLHHGELRPRGVFSKENALINAL